MKRIRPPFKYYGGKYYLSKWIIPHFPPHKTYVEPFGGAASILLNKRRADKEVYNDLNASIVHLMTYIRDHHDVLVKELRNITCEEDVFYEWKEKECDDPLQKALKVFVLYRMSRSGSGLTFSKSSRSYRGMPENASAFLSAIDNLERVSARLQGVEIECQEAIGLMKKTDSPDTLFYLDPPYLSSSRKSFSEDNARFELDSIYQLEMTDDDHAELLDACLQCQGKVVISGYESDLYENRLKHWEKHGKETYLHSSQSKKKSYVQEIVWANFTHLPHACCTTKRSYSSS